MAECKLLDFNLDKSCWLIIGNKKFKNKINNEVMTNPIMFCQKQMRLSESEKYLGDYMCTSLSESVFVTVQRRKGLAMRLISELKVTIEDVRINTVGGLTAGLEIWKLAIVPFLYNNSETWVAIPKKALNVLESIQNAFFVSLFGTSRGCPIPIFYWDTGLLTVENFIIQKKLLFYHHLLTLNDDTLAKEVLLLQEENELPGLVLECKEHLSQLDITSDPRCYSKLLWTRIIKYNIHKFNRSQLLDRIKTYKKLSFEQFVTEEYGLQSYIKNMNIRDGRTFFAHRAQMVRTVQMNFKHMYAANSNKCICGEFDHQVHLTSCPSYAHLRDGLDVLGSDLDLVRYYQLVIRERVQAEEREEQKQRNRD